MKNKLEVKIRDYIINLLDSNKIGEDDKLPSENEIAGIFKTSRYSVRAVYDTLEKMGLLYSLQGVGRFACKRMPDINLVMSSTSFTKKMEESNIPFETKNIGARKLSAEEQKKYNDMGLTGGVYEIVRLRIIYNENAAIHTSYLSEEIFPDIESCANEILSIHQYYEDRGIQNLYNSDKLISVSFPTYDDMNILKCESLVPILVFEGKLFDGDKDTLIEITKTKYRSDLFRYILK